MAFAVEVHFAHFSRRPLSVEGTKLFSVKNAANHIRSDGVVVERVRRVFGPARPPHRIGPDFVPRMNDVLIFDFLPRPRNQSQFLIAAHSLSFGFLCSSQSPSLASGLHVIFLVI